MNSFVHKLKSSANTARPDPRNFAAVDMPKFPSSDETRAPWQQGALPNVKNTGSPGGAMKNSTKSTNHTPQAFVGVQNPPMQVYLTPSKSSFQLKLLQVQIIRHALVDGRTDGLSPFLAVFLAPFFVKLGLSLGLFGLNNTAHQQICFPLTP